MFTFFFLFFVLQILAVILISKLCKLAVFGLFVFGVFFFFCHFASIKAATSFKQGPTCLEAQLIHVFPKFVTLHPVHHSHFFEMIFKTSTEHYS